jgi:hypothetical protein
MLVDIIGDYPALAKLLNMKSQPTPEACFLCKEAGIPITPQKTLYGQFWRYLPPGHPGRAASCHLNCVNPRNSSNSTTPDAETPAPPLRSFPPAHNTSKRVTLGSVCRCLWTD